MKSMCAIVMAALVALPAFSNSDVVGKTVKGDPGVKSIEVLGFAPGGVLFIGDGRGAQIVAVVTGDTKSGPAISAKIEKIDEKIAGRIGAGAKDIEILSVAINPASGKAYFAVRKQTDKTSLIVTLDGDGKISDLPLTNVEYARVPLPQGEKGPVTRITDVAWAGKKLLASAQASEEFGSKIFVADGPLQHEGKGQLYSAETYHVAHGKWETKAPMSVVIPLKEDGKTYVVGAFSCTPIVKYPIDEIKSESTVKGTSMIELGNGNQPRDMFVYEKDGKSCILANTVRVFPRNKIGPGSYWTVKFEQGLLIGSDKDNTNEKALRRLGRDNKPATDKIQVVESFAGVMQMDKLDAKRALTIRQTEKGLDLEPLALP